MFENWLICIIYKMAARSSLQIVVNDLQWPILVQTSLINMYPHLSIFIALTLNFQSWKVEICIFVMQI